MSRTPAALPSRRSVAVALLFTASGAAALIYQVLWSRGLRLFFGNTVHAAAAMFTVFMLGLGLGGFLGGRLADTRLRSPRALLAAFGVVEISIGVIGLILAWAMPSFLRFAAWMPGYTVVHGEVARLGAVTTALRVLLMTAVLLPPTLLMGSTLPLLGKFVTRSAESIGAQLGLLYGFNIAGGVVGSLLAGLALIRWFGVLGGQRAVAVAGMLVGTIALILASREPIAIAAPTLPESPADLDPPLLLAPGELREGRERVPFVAIGIAYAVSGFCGMGLEVVWMRVLVPVLQAFRSTLSLLLAVILLGMMLGTWLGARWSTSRRIAPLTAYAISQAALAVAVVALLPLLPYLGPLRARLMAGTRSAGPFASGILASSGVAITALLLPALLMGVSFPLANAVAQRSLDRVGRDLGRLVLWNTMGSVLGSLAVGFGMIAAIGSQDTLLVLAAMLFLSALGLARQTRKAALVAGVLAVFGLAVLYVRLLPDTYLVDATFFSVDPMQIKHRREGTADTIVIGQNRLGLTLYINNHPMSANEIASRRYMKLMAHLPLLMQADPHRALVICFGVGNTAHAASLHPGIERLEIVDNSEDVLAVGSFFTTTNRDVLNAAMVHVFLNDGRHHLLLNHERYDLITSEPPPIAHAGVVDLYTREYYQLAREHLTDDGLITQWLPIYQVDTRTSREVIRAFVDVFPGAALYAGYGAELILIGGRAPVVFHADRVAAALRARTDVAADLAALGAGSAEELFSGFITAPLRLSAYVRDVPPVTDDRPTLEERLSYGHYYRGMDARLRSDATEISALYASPGVNSAPTLDTDVRDTWLVMNRLFWSGAFWSDGIPRSLLADASFQARIAALESRHVAPRLLRLMTLAR